MLTAAVLGAAPHPFGAISDLPSLALGSLKLSELAEADKSAWAKTYGRMKMRVEGLKRSAPESLLSLTEGMGCKFDATRVGLKPILRPTAGACLPVAQAVLSRFLAGVEPFAYVRQNGTSNYFWKFWNPGTKTLTITVAPPPAEGKDIFDRLEDMGEVFVDAAGWAYGKVTDALRYACRMVGDPSNQAATGAALSVLVATGTVSAGTTTLVAGGVALAQSLCASAGLAPPAGAPPSSIARILNTTSFVGKNKLLAYPPGTIARFNTSRGVWSIYTPLQGPPMAGWERR